MNIILQSWKVDNLTDAVVSADGVSQPANTTIQNLVDNSNGAYEINEQEGDIYIAMLADAANPPALELVSSTIDAKQVLWVLVDCNTPSLVGGRPNDRFRPHFVG